MLHYTVYYSVAAASGPTSSKFVIPNPSACRVALLECHHLNGEAPLDVEDPQSYFNLRRNNFQENQEIIPFDFNGKTHSFKYRIDFFIVELTKSNFVRCLPN